MRNELVLIGVLFFIKVLILIIRCNLICCWSRFRFPFWYYISLFDRLWEVRRRTLAKLIENFVRYKLNSSSSSSGWWASEWVSEWKCSRFFKSTFLCWEEQQKSSCCDITIIIGFLFLPFRVVNKPMHSISYLIIQTFVAARSSQLYHYCSHLCRSSSITLYYMFCLYKLRHGRHQKQRVISFESLEYTVTIVGRSLLKIRKFMRW
jgi:hypothetical protein